LGGGWIWEDEVLVQRREVLDSKAYGFEQGAVEFGLLSL
jgi:hypothetical protein